MFESRNNTATQIKPLTAWITKVSNYGEVKSLFSRKMVVPPTHIIRHDMMPARSLKHKFIPALILKVVPGK